ncbi:MAG: hypothetical protein K0R57_2174 [Paenibacillaceae bacterium]|jgi:hypothetical protein|nr:hypothetical protein [Paenibacillaceae bacterium]
MLLYRLNKLVEEHSLTKQGFADPDGELAELTQGKESLEMSMLGITEEDCSDWAAEAN